MFKRGDFLPREGKQPQIPDQILILHIFFLNSILLKWSMKFGTICAQSNMPSVNRKQYRYTFRLYRTHFLCFIENTYIPSDKHRVLQDVYTPEGRHQNIHPYSRHIPVVCKLRNTLFPVTSHEVDRDQSPRKVDLAKANRYASTTRAQICLDDQTNCVTLDFSKPFY